MFFLVTRANAADHNTNMSIGYPEVKISVDIKCDFLTSGKRTWTDSFPPDDVATVPIMFNSKTIKEHTMLVVPNDTDLQKAAEEIQTRNREEQKAKLLKIGATASSSSGMKK